MTLARVAIVTVWTVTSAVLLAGPRAPADQATQVRATWQDLETWPSGTGRGLGLHLSGASGTVLVAFIAPEAGDVTVQVSTGPVANPNRVHTATLLFKGTDDEKRPFQIDLGSRLTVDNPAPGAQVTSGVARLRAAEFERLQNATALTAQVLGLDVAVRPDQLAAMRALR